MSGRPKPRVVLEFLSRCGQEDFVAWWEVEKPRDPHEAMWVITLNRSSGIFTVSSFPVEVHHWSHQVYGSAYDFPAMRRQLDDYGLWNAPEE